MCTLAWGQNPTGLWVCFNRDEQRSRLPAEPPCLHGDGAYPLIYARDPEGGGTWFAASTAGFAVALLNQYPEEGVAVAKAPCSRGRIVLDLAGLGSPRTALEQLKRTDLTSYAPFVIFILSRSEQLTCFWDGRRLTFSMVEDGFWTTSSVNAPEILAWRHQWWRANSSASAMDAATAGRLMRITVPENPAYGLTMDRPDARTLSQVELQVEEGACTFSYRVREADGSSYKAPVIIHHPCPT